ncbi:MAG: hypothetical protein NW241_09260 [Bacteroidia bacterium]|nr:hypothetical protein [Bacteroidia bacterium]
MKPYLLLPALLLLAACKPCDDPANPECPNYCADETNPKCPNYDPCKAETPVSAEFRIIESDRSGFLQVLDTMYYDTFYTPDLITEAIHQHDDWTYRWIIGAGEYEGKSTALDYSPAIYGAPVQMTLIVEGPPNTACFPEDDGRDTVTRVIYKRSRSIENIKILGTYHGYLNGNPADTITIGFLFFPDLVNSQDEHAYKAINLKRGCSWGWGDQALSYRKMRFSNGGSVMCDNPRGLLVLDPAKTGDFDSVRIDYSLMDRSVPASQDKRLNFVFQGRRVQ